MKMQKAHHVKALLSVLLRCLTAHAVDTCALAVVHGRFANPLDCGLQVLMEGARDRAADVVSQVPGTNEEDIDPGHLCNLFNLCSSILLVPFSSSPVLSSECQRYDPTYILERLLGLDLYDGKEGVVRLLEVLELRDTARRSHGKGASEASLANGRELGRLDELPGVVCCI